MIPTAFSALRLSGQSVSATPDSRLSVNGIKTMSVNDSGAFTSSAVVQNTGQALYTLITQASGAADAKYALTSATNTLTTNLTSTGVQLGASITSLSGWAVATLLTKGAEQSYYSGLASGADSYNVLLPTGFAGKPRVVCGLEVFSPITYMHNVALVTSSGFQLYLSDVIAETGVVLHVSARY